MLTTKYNWNDWFVYVFKRGDLNDGKERFALCEKGRYEHISLNWAQYKYTIHAIAVDERWRLGGLPPPKLNGNSPLIDQLIEYAFADREYATCAIAGFVKDGEGEVAVKSSQERLWRKKEKDNNVFIFGM